MPSAGYLSPPSYPALGIFAAALQRLLVQIRQVTNLWHRHQMIASEVSTFSFHATLLMRFCGIAKLCFETPMRSEHKKTLRFLTPEATQYLLYRSSEIVIAETCKDSAKPGERQLMCFQKRLLRGMKIGTMKRRAACHAAHAEHVHSL